jgi:hypothetical protein
VTALGEVAAALLDCELELELSVAAEPALEEEPDVPEPVALEPDVPEPVLEVLVVLEDPVECDRATVVFAWVVCASAGSWPVTSWTRTAPLAARKVASDMPATRRRIARARCRRAASFSLAAARRLR